MPPFSMLILLFWVYNIFTNNPKKAFIRQLALTLFIGVFVEVGSFLELSFVRVDYWQMLSILTFITAIPLMPKYFSISKQLYIYVSILIINLFLLIAWPLNQKVVTGYGGNYEAALSGFSSYIEPSFSKFSLFIFFLALIQVAIIRIAFKLRSSAFFNYLIHKVSLGVKVVFILVLIEYILRINGLGFLYNSFIYEFFGQGASQMIEDHMRGGSYMIHGLTRESSHLAYSLFTGIIILYTESKITSSNIQNYLFMIVGIILILLSMTLTSFLVIFVLFTMGFIYKLGNIIKFEKKYALIMVVFFIFISFSMVLPHLVGDYFNDRFFTSIDDVKYILNGGYEYYSGSFSVLSSTTARVASIIENFNLLSYRLFFGAGIGTNFSHGATALTLGEVGVLGFLSYIYFYFFSVPIYRKYTYSVLILIWILVNLFISNSQSILLVRIDSFLIFVCLYLILNQEKSVK